MMKKLVLALMAGVVVAAAFTGVALAASPAQEGAGDAVVFHRKTPFFSLELIAEVLGMEPDALRAAFMDGQNLAEVIAEQGLDENDVLDALIAAAVERVNTAHAAGNLTDSQAEKLLERLENNDLGTAWMEKFPFRMTLRQKIIQRLRERPGLVLEDVAEALDIAPEELRKALAEGQTLGEFLEAEGIDATEAFEKVKAAGIVRFTQVVEQKKLAADRAEQILDKMGEDEYGAQMWERMLEWQGPRHRMPQVRPIDLRRIAGRFRRP